MDKLSLTLKSKNLLLLTVPETDFSIQLNEAMRLYEDNLAIEARKGVGKGFKREIIFQGRTKNTIKFKYREFKDDFARPAFSQELEYLLAADGTTSGSFKGVKIEVVSVNGNYIKYRVTGHIIDEPY